MKTHYDVLGVPPHADHETVKAAYRRIVKAYHPDLNEGDGAAESRSKQIITAYAVLRDPDGRARYDEQLRQRRSRARMFVITVLVSAGLVSASTLFFINFLLKPNAGASVARISASAKRVVARLEDAAPAPAESPVLAPREVTDAVPVEDHGSSQAPAAEELPPPDETASLPEPPQALAAHETAWLEVEKNGKAEDIWVFVQEHAGTPQAALAEKRLEPLIDAIDDAASLKVLAARATGGVAQRVLNRLARLSPASDGITAALPEQPSNASQSEAPPAVPQTADDAQPPAAGAPGDAGAKLASSDPQSAIHQALSLMSGGEYVATMPAVRDSVPITHGNAKYYVYRAGFWAGRGELDRALTDYDTAILLDGANIAAFHGRGLVRWRRGEGELALADLDHAIRLSFEDPKIYLDRGQLWYERGRYDRAIADFNQAIKLSPSMASAYSYRGAALRRKGEFKSAIADLDQAIRLNPDIADAYRNRELARTERDDPVEAVSEAPH